MYLCVSFYVTGMNKHTEDFLVLFVLSDQGKKNQPMRKTPPISQIFYSNNWFIKGSLKQQVETDPQRSMCSVLQAFQATSTSSPFLRLSRVQPAGPTEIHQPSPPTNTGAEKCTCPGQQVATPTFRSQTAILDSLYRCVAATSGSRCFSPVTRLSATHS